MRRESVTLVPSIMVLYFIHGSSKSNNWGSEEKERTLNAFPVRVRLMNPIYSEMQWKNKARDRGHTGQLQTRGGGESHSVGRGESASNFVKWWMSLMLNITRFPLQISILTTSNRPPRSTQKWRLGANEVIFQEMLWLVKVWPRETEMLAVWMSVRFGQSDGFIVTRWPMRGEDHSLRMTRRGWVRDITDTESGISGPGATLLTTEADKYYLDCDTGDSRLGEYGAKRNNHSPIINKSDLEA